MPAFQHSGQHRVGEAYQRVDVDGDQVAVAVGIDLREPTVGAEARIVDQDVDHPSVQHRNQRLDARLAAQITDDEFDVDARRQSLNSLPHLRQPRLVPAGEHQRQVLARRAFRRTTRRDLSSLR